MVAAPRGAHWSTGLLLAACIQLCNAIPPVVSGSDHRAAVAAGVKPGATGDVGLVARASEYWVETLVLLVVAAAFGSMCMRMLRSRKHGHHHHGGG